VPAVELAELPENVDDLVDRLIGRLQQHITICSNEYV
jgi:hypothetical protein